MNKTEVINKVSGLSGVNAPDCKKVLDAFEEVVKNEIETSERKRNLFNVVYNIMSYLKRK
ncbi:MAG: HU family DNA-binding protein [Candidatus Azobacteroides sp.]|nr:HU family DNA-binding protein [Candidatus Azobacteroides sp.]